MSHQHIILPPQLLPLLLTAALVRPARSIKVAAPVIQLEAVEFLQRQPWPGNVRELENVIQHALLLARDHPITLAHLQEARARGGRALAAPDQTLPQYIAGLLNQARQGKIDNAHARLIETSERELFAQAIQLAQGYQAKAARWLGVTRRTLRVKLAHFGLHPATTEQTTDTEEET